ncbi:MAG: hypothetical protein HPY55_01545 [Firmicutes bacterium]|nr:hypothetical protein [Bacillota bacterium]
MTLLPTYKAAVVQFEPTLFEKEENIRRLGRLVEEAGEKGARLVVTPEMGTTGYCFKSREEIAPYVEPVPGPATAVFGEIARRYSMYVVISLPEVDPATGVYYNAAALIGPDGEVAGKFRKVHSFVDETLWAKDGDLGFPVFDTPLGRLAMIICMDADFFESGRVPALKGADVICFPTNWVTKTPAKSWRARALENGVYFLAADRWGEERGIRFGGGSSIIGPRGEVMATVERGDAVVTGEISIRATRDKNVPGFGDLLGARRPEEYHAVITNPYLWQPVLLTRLPGGRRSRLTVAQFDPVAGRPGENLATMATILEEACEAPASGTSGPGPSPYLSPHVVVFPELCVTGMPPAAEMKDLAEPVPGPATDRLAGIAAEFEAHVVFGIAEVDCDGAVYNSAVVLEPGGLAGVYRKVHLNEYDREWAAPGNLGLPCFDISAGRTGVAIGTDLLIPEVARCLAKQGADVILAPSAWPWPEWDFVWSERAANNDVYLAVSNQAGRSVVYGDPSRRQASKVEGAAGFASLEMDTEMDSFCRRKEMLRKVQPVWYDPIVRKRP